MYSIDKLLMFRIYINFNCLGFQMLQKLGWSEGQGLGSEGNGRIEPINK